MTSLGEDALNRLPVGAVLIARHKTHRGIATWTKTDDTDLENEFGDGRQATAWASVTYTKDRTAEGLILESSSIRLIWDASDGEAMA